MTKKHSYDYFEFFQEMIEYGTKTVQYLQTILKDYDYKKLPEYKETMHKIEHCADVKKHEMMSSLMNEFLPPIDRDDIVKISHLLDEICDRIEEVVQLLYMDDIRTCRSDASEFTELILSQCDELTKLFGKFHKLNKDKTIPNHIVMVNTYEEDADNLYIEVVKKLHTDGTELAQQIYWKEIYSCLEDCCDACEKIADAVEEVLMKS